MLVRMIDHTSTSIPQPRKLAIIGTAGRDAAMPLTAELWRWMVADAKARVRADDEVVSGGAAWSDHLAVRLFLDGDVAALTLHLPAPFLAGRYQGEYGTSGGTANYYHERFRKVTGVDGLAEIAQAIAKGAQITEQPVARGYGANFARNKLVARAVNAAVAYTFGPGDVPADGGTKNTWGQIRGERTHVSLLAALPQPGTPMTHGVVTP
jgi:hypothetical protein